MVYSTEHIAKALRGAREHKRLSQRELSKLAGVPQSHISKIENGAVDLRLTSLVELARALDLELTLVPRQAVPAVQSIVRSGAQSTLQPGEAARQAGTELARLQKTIASLPAAVSLSNEVAKLQRLVRELQRFQLATKDIEALRAVNKVAKEFRNNTKALDSIRQAVSQLESMRNALAHGSVNLPQRETTRPAYSLDEDDNG